MARELRLIQLDRSELCAAVQSYLRMNLELIGAVTVMDVTVADSGRLAVRYRRTKVADRNEPELELTQDQACAALVRFCLENNIPLPRHGTKTAVSSAGSMTLRIQCGGDVATDRDEVKPLARPANEIVPATR